MRLSKTTLSVLGAVQLDASAPLHVISEKTGLSVPVVQYQLQKLRESGTIRRGSIVNHFALGLQQWQVYVSLDSSSYKKREAVHEFLKKNPLVYWVAELGGDNQYGMSVTVSNPEELMGFFLEVAARFGNPFREKSISHVLSYTMFKKNYFTPNVRSLDAVVVRAPPTKLETDKTDRAILGLLSDSTLDSNPRMAQKLGIPRSTFEYRVKRLEKDKIIERHVYYINSRSLGFLTYRVLTSLRGMHSKANERINQFALKDPNVVFLIQCLGSFDFEIVIEVPQAPEVTTVLDRLHVSCGDLIERIRVLPVFQQSTSPAFLRVTI